MHAWSHVKHNQFTCAGLNPTPFSNLTPKLLDSDYGGFALSDIKHNQFMSAVLRATKLNKRCRTAYFVLFWDKTFGFKDLLMVRVLTQIFPNIELYLHADYIINFNY